MTHNNFSTRASGARHRGFTLVQLLLVIGLIALLSALLVGQFGRGRASVQRAECDVHLKEIVLAMDTFRQETGHLPKRLVELSEKGYLPMETLRCPADPDLATNSSKPAYSSYANYYVQRDPIDDGELPILVCPFHEKEGMHGAQGFKGGYTKTFAARPAILSGAQGAVTVTRPGEEGVLAMPASGRLEVRGGDKITLGSGTATLTFADASVAKLTAGSELRVLESYLETQDRDSIYTLVRQIAGTISYSVIPGNKFDVATPTATAGALGTEFTISIVAPTGTDSTDAATLLKVDEHAVAFTVKGRTIEVDTADTAGVRSDDAANASKPHAPRDAKAKKIKKGKNTDEDEKEQKKDEKEKKEKRDKSGK